MAERKPPPAASTGWYEDPDNSKQLRQWDGNKWTEHTAPKGFVPSNVPPEKKPRKTSPIAWVLLIVLLAFIAWGFYSYFQAGQEGREMVCEAQYGEGNCVYDERFNEWVSR